MSAKNGFISIALIIMISYMLTCVFCWVSFVVTGLRSQRYLALRQKAFYFAASGIEIAKVRLSSDPDWSTDSALTADKSYLLTVASGETCLIGDGGCRILRSKGTGDVYSIGFIGTDINSSGAYSFQKMTFSAPFKKTHWEEF